MDAWQKINFSVPIIEKVRDGKQEFTIRGTAINETTTRNGTRFLAEELEKSGHTLRNKPILKDHNNSVDSIVGMTTENVGYSPDAKAVLFEAIIDDESIQRKIERGLIKNVSIGAMVKELRAVKNKESDEIEAYVAKGIDFVELSLVAVPADPNAGFTKAIMESFTMQPAPEAGEPVIIEQSVSQEENIMAEETQTLEAIRAEKQKLEAEKLQLELDIEKINVEKLKAQKEALSATTTAAVDETKGEVTSTPVNTPVLGEKYFLSGEDNYQGVAVGVTYQNHDGLKRLKR